jgi:hypothetical protein
MRAKSRSALIGVGIGSGTAAVAMALPFAFGISPLAWRSILCIGAILAAISFCWFVQEEFIAKHRNPSVRRYGGPAAIVVGIGLVVLAIWLSLVLPTPENYGAEILAILKNGLRRCVLHSFSIQMAMLSSGRKLLALSLPFSKSGRSRTAFPLASVQQQFLRKAS